MLSFSIQFRNIATECLVFRIFTIFLPAYDTDTLRASFLVLFDGFHAKQCLHVMIVAPVPRASWISPAYKTVLIATWRAF